MANFYSNHFGVGGSAAALPESVPTPGRFAPPGYGGSPVKHRYGVIDFSAAGAGSFADDDVVAFFPIKSDTRIIDLRLSANAAFNTATTCTLDLGLHEAVPGSGAVSTVIDLNLFCTLVNIDATAIAGIDAFTEAGTLADIDRGKTAWELADIGGGTYTADPRETWLITGTLQVAGAVTAGGILTLEMRYKDD
jgi:hypothetical protein